MSDRDKVRWPGSEGCCGVCVIQGASWEHPALARSSWHFIYAESWWLWGVWKLPLAGGLTGVCPEAGSAMTKEIEFSGSLAQGCPFLVDGAACQGPPFATVTVHQRGTEKH